MAGIQPPQKLIEVTQLITTTDIRSLPLTLNIAKKKKKNAPATTITGKPKPYNVFYFLQLSP